MISSRVNSIALAEILATEDADDDAKALAKALNELLNKKTELCIDLDSKDLFATLSSC